MVVNMSLIWISSLISEGATKFETAWIDDLEEKLLIYDTTSEKPMVPENAVGSIHVDDALEAYTCNFGDETMHFTDSLDAALWMLGKELE